MRNSFIRAFALLGAVFCTNVLFAEVFTVVDWRDDDNITINGKKPFKGYTFPMETSEVTFTLTSDCLMVKNEKGIDQFFTPDHFSPDRQKAQKIPLYNRSQCFIKNGKPIIGTRKYRIDGIDEDIDWSDDSPVKWPITQDMPTGNQTNAPKSDVEKPQRLEPQPIKQ